MFRNIEPNIDVTFEIEYDMGPRNPDDAIGEFPQLAFVENRNYKS